MKKYIVALLSLLITAGGVRSKPHKVLIPLSNVYVKIPRGTKPRFWVNAVEFDHKGWQEICVAEDGKAKCKPLQKASPTK